MDTLAGDRSDCVTQIVKTPFGNMFVHLDGDLEGHVLGGSISHKGKEPTSQVAELIEHLSDGLNDCAQALSARNNGGNAG